MIAHASLPADPVEYIRNAPIGTVIHGFSTEQEKIFIDFFIREASSVLNALSERPALEIRAGAVLEEEVLVLITLFRLEKDGPIYEVFWNYYRQDYQASEGNFFEHMCAEPLLALNFFGDSGEVENVVEVSNSLRPFFREMIQQVVALKPWTLAEFDKAKEAITANYSTPQELWEVMEATGGPSC